MQKPAEDNQMSLNVTVCLALTFAALRRVNLSLHNTFSHAMYNMYGTHWFSLLSTTTRIEMLQTEFIDCRWTSESVEGNKNKKNIQNNGVIQFIEEEKKDSLIIYPWLA